MISAFGIDHGEISKAEKPRKKRGVSRVAMKIDDRLEGTKLGNAINVHEGRRGYKHGFNPEPRYKPRFPGYTWPGLSYQDQVRQGMSHQAYLQHKAPAEWEERF